MDEEVTREAVHVLATADPEASFVYLGAVDETAHFLGCGEEYRASMRTADERLGRLLGAVRSRPGHADEAWTVIVVTDHGHVDAGGHGGRTPRSAPPGWPAPAPASRPPRRSARSATRTSPPRCTRHSVGPSTRTGLWTAARSRSRSPLRRESDRTGAPGNPGPVRRVYL
ncbi:alkaline phosphatase family protein [Kitasatospora aburaviensis]